MFEIFTRRFFTTELTEKQPNSVDTTLFDSMKELS